MKILALDIGQYSVKAVLLDSSFGKIELSDHFSELVTEPEPIAPQEAASNEEEKDSKEKKEVEKPKRVILTEGQKLALKKINKAQKTKYDKLAVNIPKGWVTQRVFTFPTKDRKTIHSSIAFELEDEIPFGIEETISDFATIKTEGNSSTVFTTIALRSDVEELIADLNACGFDPETITIDAWSGTQLMKKACPDGFQAKPIMLLNIGAKKSTLQILVGSEPVITHICNVGGDHITNAIATHYGLSFVEAEKSKIEGAFILTETHLKNGIELTEDQKHFSAVIEDALAPLIREIKQTVIAYKSQFQYTIKGIFLTGGSCQISNLQLYIEENTSIPVYHYRFISRLVGQTLQLSESNEVLISNAVGLALTFIKPDRSSNLNLRKDDLAKHGGSAFNLQTYRKVMIYAAVTLAFIYANLIAQYFVLNNRVEKKQADVEKAIESVLGAVTPSTMKTYLTSPSTLKSAVDKELAKYKEAAPANIKPQLSGFDLLNKISATMARDMTLDVNLFELRDGKFKLTGAVEKNPGEKSNQVEKVKTALEDTKLLSEITKVKADEDFKKHLVKFEFTAMLASDKATTDKSQSGKNPKDDTKDNRDVKTK